MTEQKRKVLGVNRNALALNKATNSSTTNRSTVLVITKGKGAITKDQSKIHEDSHGSLTEEETQRRFMALQKAGKNRIAQKEKDQKNQERDNETKTSLSEETVFEESIKKCIPQDVNQDTNIEEKNTDISLENIDQKLTLDSISNNVTEKNNVIDDKNDEIFSKKEEPQSNIANPKGNKFDIIEESKTKVSLDKSDIVDINTKLQADKKDKESSIKDTSSRTKKGVLVNANTPTLSDTKIIEDTVLVQDIVNISDQSINTLPHIKVSEQRKNIDKNLSKKKPIDLSQIISAQLTPQNVLSSSDEKKTELTSKTAEIPTQNTSIKKSTEVKTKPILPRNFVSVSNETKQISLENMKEIMQKGKIRNLDSLHKKEEIVIEVEIEPVAPATVALQAVTQIATKAKQQTVVNTNIKTRASLEKEEKANKKTFKATKNTSQRKLSSSQMIQMTGSSGDDNEFRSSRRKHRKNIKTQSLPEKIIRDVLIPDVISVQELANRMAEKAGNVVKALMKLGVIATINQSIDADTAEIICTEFGHNLKRVTSAEILSNLLVDEVDQDIDLILRNPVVTVMGHVDHGKTSLLDALRSTDIAAGESGGITQHIGAYKVALNTEKFITFLDTPGHEAFTAMRMRGAKVTDIVVLVVAADDGIKAQTVEAISHAKAANVPIIVAINKIDKQGANIEAVKNSLFQHNLIPDDMGGDTMVIPVSAKSKIGLDKLEEAILLQADLLNLRANPIRLARGHVIEAHIDKGRGPVATFLIEKGTLKAGDVVVVGHTYGKIKAMIDDKSHLLKEAGPSTPTEIIGLDSCPIAGDEFIVVSDEKVAKEVASHRIQAFNEKKHAITAKKTTSIEDLFSKAKSGVKELALIVKSDVQGSAEAIVQSLEKLANDEVKTKVLLGAVGGITESDITLAAASKAIVLGFNVRANAAARDFAKNYNVEIQYYSIIYDLLDNIKSILGGMLNPLIKEIIIGQVQIRRVFETSKFGKIAGCYVTEGQVKRGASVRLLRDNIVVHEGKIKSLKRQKDDAKEVKEGYECGISLENYDDIRDKDMIEVFEVTSEKRDF